MRKAVAALALAGSLSGCTFVVGSAMRSSAKKHNAEVAAKGSGETRSVGGRTAAGVVLGFLVDVAVIGALVFVSDDSML